MTSQYHIIRFSPVPEIFEPTNIALLLLDEGQRPSIHYDPSFPRLSCVAPDFNVDFLGSWLDSLSRELRDFRGDDCVKLLTSRSGQLFVMERCVLLGGIEPEILVILQRIYLAR